MLGAFLLWRQCCALCLAVCALGSKDASYGTPTKPIFEHATDVNAISFIEDVEMVANGTDRERGEAQLYNPIVLFHVSWCSHCRDTLPEIQEAAQIINEALKGGRWQVDSPPKFFTIECDANRDVEAICDKHVAKGSYPMIKMFRDHRAIAFNRPRLARTIAWWASHMGRNAVMEVAEKAHVESMNAVGPFFMLRIRNFSQEAKLQAAWKETALDFLEDCHFGIVRDESNLGQHFSKTLNRADRLVARGRGVDALPFEGKMNRKSLAFWVNFNRFSPITNLTPYTATNLEDAGLPVVTFVHDWGVRTAPLLREFQAKVGELRPHKMYLFASVNASDEDTVSYMDYRFALVAPKRAPPPRVFAFKGDAYWESQMKPTDLSLESIAALLLDGAARQDSSWSSWFKGRWKLTTRYALSGPAGFVVVLGAWSAVVGFVWLLVRSLKSSDTLGAGEALARKTD